MNDSRQQDMPEGWKRAAIAEVTSMVKRGKAPAYTDAGGVAVLGQRCVRDGRVDWDTARKTDPSRKAVPTWAWICSGDILVNSTGHGTLGRTGFVGSVPVPSTVDSHVTIVRPDPTAVVPKFLAYMLRTMEHDLEALASGSTGQTELSPQLIAATSFALPSIEEQERIVDLLETVDAMEIATEELAKSGALATLVLREQLFSDLSEAFAALPLRDLMIRVRRPVSIGREQSYSQIGVRSHGKGIFHKDLVKGSDLGTKKVFLDSLRRSSVQHRLCLGRGSRFSTARRGRHVRIASLSYLSTNEPVRCAILVAPLCFGVWSCTARPGLPWISGPQPHIEPRYVARLYGSRTRNRYAEADSRPARCGGGARRGFGKLLGLCAEREAIGLSESPYGRASPFGFL